MIKMCAVCGNKLNHSVALWAYKYSCPKCGPREYDHQIKEQ